MESNHCDDRSGIRAILFDLDNTLIATRRADKLACNKMAETISQTYGVPTEIAKQSCKQFLHEFRKCPEHPSIHLDTWRHQLWYEALPLPYNKFSGLITNGPSKSQWEKINKLNLKSLFDVILVSGDLPWEKPHEKIFERAYQYLGVRPENCLMVGDKLETDILGGFQARLGGTVWVPLNINEIDSKFEPGPDFVIDNVTELPKMLKNSYKQPKLRRKSRDSLRPYNLKSFSEPDFSDCNSNGSDGS